MDRTRVPQGLWLAALILASCGFLLFALDRQVNRLFAGQNEEVGVALLLAAVAASVAGLLVRRSLHRWDARIALGSVAAVALLVAAGFTMALLSMPDHDRYRRVEWERLEERPARAVVLGDDDLAPYPELAARLAATGPGGHGAMTMEPDAYRALWAMLGERTAPGEEPVVEYRGMWFRLMHGPVA